MSTEHNARTGGQILIDALRTHGADLAFCVPGESYLAALDALHDAPEIRLVVCRQEGGAAMMADAYGRMTGRPGLCFVTRGPGATNASAGVHIAFQDSTPMILFVGQVARGMSDREAFQEVDIPHAFAPLAKWAAQIEDPARIPEYVSRAYHTAVNGRPGPVVLALPEDMLTEEAGVADAGPYRPSAPHPGAADMARLGELLAAAERPLVILGGGGWSDAAIADLQAFAEANHLPVAVTFRCQDYFDNSHPNYAGHVGIGPDPKLAARVRESDLLIVVGARLGEMTTGGYTLVDVPRPRQGLVHVFPDGDELGRVYQADLPIHAAMGPFAAAARALAPVDAGAWAAATEEAHADYLAFIAPTEMPGDVQFAEIMVWLRETLPAEAIITNGAGNFAVWVNRFHQWRRFGTQLAPTSGSMGYGTPAAVAAKLVHPDWPVVCFAGDGDFLMNGQELATAVQYDLPIIVILVNNGMYGTIRMHQEREYPGRVSGTALQNPDFAALARAYGAHGETVERTEDFAPAFARAQQAGRPALIELRIAPDAITPTKTLTGIREAALEGRR
ncbi:MAG: thiamine pyrophosphate-binding protein [Alphaproteobacteria bacterium]|nr:thiamine pyrophosphate-binding protein [Alphaproteobacteria bacterium]